MQPPSTSPEVMSTWQQLVDRKTQQRDEAIRNEWRISSPSPDQLDVTTIPESSHLLTSFELEITETSDVELILNNLATGRWTSVDVTKAFYKRAVIAHQVTNCLTEIFIDRALERAKECDNFLERYGRPMGVLHGLPVSLKDQINMKGLDSTMGYVSWIGDPAKRDATIISILYEAGAVPFVKTNLPQTLMWPETFNNVFGRTLNPFNRRLTSGGSSGGEGALIGMKGSPLGIGSDIGGSIRIPASFNGFYGLRPSSGRIPFEGCVNSTEGQDSIPSVLGPLSASLSGVKIFMKTVLASEPWRRDPLVLRMPWNEDAYQLREHGFGKSLCFAFLWNDGLVIPHPPVRRAMEIVKKALIAKGHKVIDWPGFNYGELCANFAAIMSAGAGEEFVTICSKTNEPIITTMDPESKSATSLLSPESLTPYQVWQLQKKKAELRKAHLDVWQSTSMLTGTGRPIDAIIAPVAGSAAPPHGKNRSANYTLIWNGLDYPACAFPVTKVDPDLDSREDFREFIEEFDKMNFELYDPEVFSNAPVGLQLVGQPQEDEAVIRMTEIVDAALKGSDTPSATPVNRLMASLLSWSTWVLPHGLPLVSSLTGDTGKMSWSPY